MQTAIWLTLSLVHQCVLGGARRMEGAGLRDGTDAGKTLGNPPSIVDPQTKGTRTNAHSALAPRNPIPLIILIMLLHH